jgi:hypothetical protein
MIDGRGRVRITDFGLAGVAEELTSDGTVSGTPAYMAPEQLAGGAASVQSDLYALGLVLYELFTGKRAFDSQDPAVIRRLQADSSPKSPSSLTPDIEPASSAWSCAVWSASRAIVPSPPTRYWRAPGRGSARGGAGRGGDAVAGAGRERARGREREAGGRDRVRPLRAWRSSAGVLRRVRRVSRASLDRTRSWLCVRRTFSRRRESRSRLASRTAASVRSPGKKWCPCTGGAGARSLWSIRVCTIQSNSVRAPAGRAGERHDADRSGRAADPARGGDARGKPRRGGFSRRGRSGRPRGLAGPRDRGRLRRESDDPRRSYRPSRLLHRLRHGLERAGPARE